MGMGITGNTWSYVWGRYCRRSASVRQMYLSSLALMIISFSCRASQPMARSKVTGDIAGTHPHYADNAGIVPVWVAQQIYLVINRVGVTTRVKVTVVGYIE